MLKVSAFYLEKQKSFIPKKIFLGRCHYQNKKALFADPIFSEGFEYAMRTSHSNTCFFLLRVAQRLST